MHISYYNSVVERHTFHITYFLNTFTNNNWARLFSCLRKRTKYSNSFPCYDTKYESKLAKNDKNRISGMAHENSFKLYSLKTWKTIQKLSYCYAFERRDVLLCHS